MNDTYDIFASVYTVRARNVGCLRSDPGIGTSGIDYQGKRLGRVSDRDLISGILLAIKRIKMKSRNKGTNIDNIRQCGVGNADTDRRGSVFCALYAKILGLQAMLRLQLLRARLVVLHKVRTGKIVATRDR